jgi:DNA polymerase I-like protein with 3'-5' exonuclease and polymerase domains
MPEFTEAGEEVKGDDKASTGVKALLKLLDHGVPDDVAQFVDALLLFRGYDKLRGTYLTDRHTTPSPWPGIDRLQPTYLIPGTSTGRFASNPNVQNIPSRGLINVKQIFVPPPGHTILKADFDQIEARIFAKVAGDKLVLEAIETGKDIHTLTAARVFSALYKGETEESLYKRIQYARKHLEKSDPEYLLCNNVIRPIAKGVRFRKQYGGGGKGLYLGLSTERDRLTNERTFPNLERDQVKRWDMLWTESNPWTPRWQKRVLRDVYRNKRVQEPVDGRYRYFPVKPATPNEPPNHEIQGAAAAYANRALIAIDKRCRHFDWSEWSGIFSQVHDEIALYCPDDRVDEAEKIMAESMHYNFRGVEISAEVERCERWG